MGIFLFLENPKYLNSLFSWGYIKFCYASSSSTLTIAIWWYEVRYSRRKFKFLICIFETRSKGLLLQGHGVRAIKI